MKDWLQQYTPREQLSLLILSAAVGLYLVYMLIWSPVAQKHDELVRRNLSVGETLLRVEAMVSEVRALRANGGQSSAPRNLTALINRSTAQQTLQVSRLQPNSRGEVQVRFEAASFSQLLRWLHQMEYSESLLLKEVSITQTGQGGRVNATVRLAQ